MLSKIDMNEKKIVKKKRFTPKKQQRLLKQLRLEAKKMTKQKEREMIANLLGDNGINLF